MFTTKRLSFLLVCTLPLLVLACSASKPAYQKPVLKPGDTVLARVSKTVFTVAEVCASKAADSQSQSSRCSRTYLSPDSIAKLKEDQVIVSGCLGAAYDRLVVAPAESDEIILYQTSKDGSPNLQPPVEPGDIVVVLGAGRNIQPTSCDGEQLNDSEKLFPAVKVVKLEGGELQFSFLNKNTEESHKEAYSNRGQAGVYTAKAWWVPSPKLAEILKQP